MFSLDIRKGFDEKDIKRQTANLVNVLSALGGLLTII